MDLQCDIDKVDTGIVSINACEDCGSYGDRYSTGCCKLHPGHRKPFLKRELSDEQEGSDIALLFP